MNEAVTPPSLMPRTRPNAFDPPTELAFGQVEVPMRRMTYADGHLGWLVSGYAANRAVLADQRFSARLEHIHPPMGIAEGPGEPAPPGMFLMADPPDHARYRKLLTGQFTVRRMSQLSDRIEEIVHERLDAMAELDPPVDLVREYARPIPSLMICEMLGVPYEERAFFQDDFSFSFDETNEVAQAKVVRVSEYVERLAARKRVDPGDDMLTGLTKHPELSDAEIAGMGMLLLIAGHETTQNMLGLGTLALLQNPAQLAAMRDDDQVDAGVEELLRYLSVVHVIQRVAREDVEIEGRLIRAGETVTLSLSGANRDAERFAAPSDLDVAAGAPGHLAFGHGIHQCLGQQLARIELRLAFPALLRRFPTLRLAVPWEDVPMRESSAIYGVDELPVTW